MRVIWQTKARQGRNQVAKYIQQYFGTNRRDKFLQQVRETTRLLKTHPDLGSIDPLFADRPKTYRSIIINGLSKLVYLINDEVIHIVGFWDTRQEPENQAAQTE